MISHFYYTVYTVICLLLSPLVIFLMEKFYPGSAFTPLEVVFFFLLMSLLLPIWCSVMIFWFKKEHIIEVHRGVMTACLLWAAAMAFAMVQVRDVLS